MSSLNDDIADWFNAHRWIYGVIAFVIVLIVAAALLICVCCCFCCRRRRRAVNRMGQAGDRERLVQNNGVSKPQSSYGAAGAPVEYPSTREPSVVGEMNRQRREQEKIERDNAKQAVDYHLRNTQKYTDIASLPDMGSRMQKYWFKVKPKDSEDEVLLTIAPVSQRCPLKLDNTTLKAINSLMATLQCHPYIYPVLDMSYLHDKKQLIVCQPLATKGSLKDLIYRATPTSDWSQKYSRRSRGLSADKVAVYGRHVLEAMVFLDGKGFPPLGHVQSGNCFIVDNICQLSGYENTILGYKTRVYRIVKDHLEHTDIIMFGHLVFEMSCGYELTSVYPSVDDYIAVKSDRVKEVLEFIFTEGFPHDVDEIIEHKFFREVAVKHLKPFDSDTIKVSGDMKSVLKTVARGKPVRKQPKAKKTKTPVLPPNKPPLGTTSLPEGTASSEQGGSGAQRKPTPAARKKLRSAEEKV